MQLVRKMHRLCFYFLVTCTTEMISLIQKFVHSGLVRIKWVLFIFNILEGTTTNGFYLLPFKTGAFLAGVPIQPVILKYSYRRFSPAWDSISGVSSACKVNWSKQFVVKYIHTIKIAFEISCKFYYFHR